MRRPPNLRSPEKQLKLDLFWILFWMVCFITWGSLLGGCGVRSVTTCLTYDRSLQRPDPNTLIQRDSAGASVCVETGPKE
jgi:hypothetical protein